MSRKIYYVLLGIVAAVGLWFVADAPAWWSGGSPFRGPLAPMAEESALGQLDWVPCTALTSEQQEALAYGGNRPVESCRIEAADTVVVLLRSADSTVMSLVRVWSPGAERLDAEYGALQTALNGDWGDAQPCPENDQRGAAGNLVWTRDDAHVRLFKRLPDQLVLDYELGPGGCQIPS